MYKQADYPQTIGNGARTIENDGSLIVAFTNLLVRMGFDITPERLNNFFINKNVYGPNDELTWTSLAYYNNVGIDVVTEMNAHSVVRIEKDGVSVYALVDNPSANTIIDSLTGTSRVISELGEGKEFYAYKVYEPIAYPTVQEPVTAIIADGESYVVTVPINGYGFSSDAIAHKDEKDTVQPGVYHVFNRVGDMINVTKDQGQVGLWINPADNLSPSFTASPENDTPEVDNNSNDEPEKINVKVIPPDPNKFKQTWHPNLGMVEQYAKESITVTDLSGENEPKLLPKGTIVPVAGEFIKDGITYVRTVQSVGADKWYGVPKNMVSKTKDGDDDIDDAFDNINLEMNEIKAKKAIKAVATTHGSITRFNPFSYVKGKKK